MYFNIIPTTIISWLSDTLITQQNTLREFDIIQHWQTNGWLPQNCMSSQLSLFRTHFYVFHALYTLKKNILSEGLGDLDIHTLGTYFIPSKETTLVTKAQQPKINSRELHYIDTLLHYYLDWRPLFETEEGDIERLMQFAHAGISRPYQLKAAFKRFEITPPTSEQQIKKAYRKLAKKHHPDKGGSVQSIQQVNEDKSLLIQWLQYQQI